ncbi:MAG: helix-turn-helix domain-containing protein [Gemmatimonadales bacterium]
MSKARRRVSPRVAQALAKLGADLRNARRRQRMPMAYAADLARISRSTLYKVERGDPGISLGILATLLVGYGMLERFESLMEARFTRFAAPRCHWWSPQAPVALPGRA